MPVISLAGYTWKQCQAQAEYRLKDCFEFAGVFLESSANPVKKPAYKNASAAKREAYAKCVKIAESIPCSSEVVVTGHSCNFFTCSFFTTDPVNGNIDRVYWITYANKYYADV